MKFKTLVLSLIVVSTVSYAGLKLHIYLQVKDILDEVVQKAQPFVEIQTGSIGSTLDGAIQIDDIVLRPRAFNDSLEVEQFNIITPGLQFLLNGKDSMRDGEIPSRLGLQITGARLNLYGEFVAMLEQAAQESQPYKQPSADELCSLSPGNPFAEYRELGLKELVFDGEVIFERTGESSDMKISMAYTSRGIEQTKISTTLQGFGTSITRVAVATPLLKNLAISYKSDPKFASNWLQYCSKHQGTDINTYIDRLFDHDDRYYAEALGFVPGPGIRNAFKQFIATNAELRIDATPPSPLDMNTVHLYNPADWPNLFGLTVFLDQTRITDLTFSIPKDAFSRKALKATLNKFKDVTPKDPSDIESSDTKPTLAEPAMTDSSPKSTTRYHAADARDISRFVQKNVRIVTVEGYRRSGRVLRIKDNTVTLEQRLKGGSLSTDVPVRSIGKLEVLE